MYSGTTFRVKSGRVIGVHQKIDRIARRHLKSHIPKELHFPTGTDILHFEGLHGPDGIKRKSPAKDEPWHFINPKNPNDRALFGMMREHIQNLALALRENNVERGSFEAAWLAHAVVDGLTPAHHYPLGDKIEELWGKAHTERISVIDKNVIKGINRRDTLSKNWQYWGPHGVFTAHILFEWGVALAIAPLRFDDASPHDDDFTALRGKGFDVIFLESLTRVSDLGMYDEFLKTGWSRKLIRQTRKELIPEIIKTVTLAWYEAILLAEKRV